MPDELNKAISPVEGTQKYWISLAMVAILGVLISIVLFLWTREIEFGVTEERFKAAAKERSSLFKQEIKSSLYEIESLGAFYGASENVSRQEFRSFVQPFLSHNPSIQALEWIPKVTAIERSQHEQTKITGLASDYQIKERDKSGRLIRALERSEYYPVFFAEPMGGNEKAVGFDLASNTTRKQALESARDSGNILATARITLVQEEAEQYGFLVFLPLYDKGNTPTIVEERRQNIQGFALGVFRVGNMLEKALSYLDPVGINVAIYDDSGDAGHQFLGYHAADDDSEHPEALGRAQLTQQLLMWSDSFEVAGRNWTILFTPTKTFVARGKSITPWLILMFGLLLSFSFSGYLFLTLKRLQKGQDYSLMMLNAKEKLQQEVEIRTIAEQKMLKSKRKLEVALQQLQEKQSQLLHSEKLASVGQLAAGVAHEINNPTGYVKGNLEVMVDYKASIQKVIESYSNLEKLILAGDDRGLKDALSQVAAIRESEELDFIFMDIDELLSDSIKGAKRIQKIVQDLKSFSRVDDQENKAVDINTEVIETSLRLVWNEIKYKTKLKTSLSPLPLYSCRAGELGQVILNLLINACDAIDDQGDITLSTDVTETDIIIRIADTGCGIKDEDLMHIFDPFFTTKEVGKGTGLGLSISHEIIKKHGGTLTVSSHVGEGTEFTIKLPLTSDEKILPEKAG